MMRSVIAEEFEIHFEWDGDILSARVEGPSDSFEISLAYWKMIAAERVRCGAERVLVLEYLKQTGKEGDVMALSEHLVELDFQGAKVAFVDLSDAHRAAQEHVTIIAREHGIQASIFGTKNQALTWLRYGED